jgi:vacuolar-type H+-ATPase subunit H
MLVSVRSNATFNSAGPCLAIERMHDPFKRLSPGKHASSVHGFRRRLWILCKTLSRISRQGIALILALHRQGPTGRPAALARAGQPAAALRLRGGAVDKEPAKKVVAAGLDKANQQAQSFLSKIHEPTMESAAKALNTAGEQAQSYVTKIKEPAREAAASLLDTAGGRAQSFISRIRTMVAGAPKHPAVLAVTVGAATFGTPQALPAPTEPHVPHTRISTTPPSPPPPGRRCRQCPRQAVLAWRVSERLERER